MTAVLKFEDVSVRRGKATLVSKLNLEVNDGERWVILGRNGAGKTTLLSLAAARMHPSAGTVDVLDSRIGRVDVFELRPRIGLASSSLVETFPHAERVLDIVITAAYGISGRWREAYGPDDVARADELLRFLGIAHLGARTFGTLSEGERKRVQIARALMTDPELLLLDEPAAGLDLTGREELVRLLGLLAGDQNSPVTIMVTHHVEEIPANYTHIALMRAGEIFAAGPIPEVLTAQNLSNTFGIALNLGYVDGRWSARAAI